VIVTKDVLNHNVTHDLKILRSYWKGDDVSEPQVYTNEEERAATTNYFKNYYAAREKHFVDVSKTKKKNVQKRFQVNNTCFRADFRIELSYIHQFHFFPCYFS